MKRLYTAMTLAAAATLGLSAQVFSLSNNVAAPILHMKQATAVASDFTLPSGKHLAAPAKAATAQQVYGTYTWTYFQFGGETPAQEFGELVFRAGKDANKVAMSGLLGSFEIIGDLDLAKGTISFPIQTVGQLKTNLGTETIDLDVRFIHMVLDDVQEDIVNSNNPVIANITEDGIEFQGNDLFGFAGCDPTSGQQYGIYTLCALSQLAKQGLWLDAGEAVFVDGILGTVFAGKTVTSTCKLQRSAENINIIRLDNAFAYYNSSMPLILDITDPDNIVINRQPTGVTDKYDGATFIASDSYLALVNGEAVDPKYVIKRNGNVIDIPANAVYANWPNADASKSPYETDPNTFYQYKNALASTITLPADFDGIEGIELDAANGPVEYYNLQGVRVTEPAAGLYIRRQGNTATKVLVK